MTDQIIAFRSRLVSAADWAAAGEGRVERHPLVRPFDPTGAIGQSCDGPWRLSYDLLQRFYRVGSWLTEGRDAKVFLWKWRLANGSVDELFLPFNQRGELLMEMPFWLQFYPFCKQDASGLVFSLPQPETRRFSGEYVFFGGKSNWGHWLIDWLSNAYFLENYSFLDGKTLVVNRMQPWQRETIRHFGIEADFLELDCQGRCGLFEFEKLWVIHGHPLPARADYMHRRLARPNPGGRRRVYLSRASMAPLHRVANEDEIQRLFEARGFEIVFPERLSLADKIAVLGDCEMVATPPGSASINYLLFTGQKAVNINFASSFMRENTPMNWVIGGMSYVVPRMDRTVLVYGERPADAPTHANLDIPERYRVEHVAAAIDAAEAMLR